MLVEIAKLWRAKFRKMRRLGGGRKFWGKRRIKRILIADRGFDGLRLLHTKVMTAGRGKGDTSRRRYVESVLSVLWEIL